MRALAMGEAADDLIGVWACTESKFRLSNDLTGSSGRTNMQGQ